MPSESLGIMVADLAATTVVATNEFMRIVLDVHSLTTSASRCQGLDSSSATSKACVLIQMREDCS